MSSASTTSVGRRSLWRDLRSGEAGFLPRFGLSIAAAAITLGGVMVPLAVIDEATMRVDEVHIAIAFALGGAAWCAELWMLWSPYRGLRAWLRPAFIIVGIWIVTIPLCAVFAEMRFAEEFLIAAAIFTAIGASVGVACAGGYKASAGRSLVSEGGSVNVACPECGYSMVGKTDCRCPECGRVYTVDELIVRQDFEAVRAARRSRGVP